MEQVQPTVTDLLEGFRTGEITSDDLYNRLLTRKFELEGLLACGLDKKLELDEVNKALHSLTSIPKVAKKRGKNK